MHRQPASPKKPCRVTMYGAHQWITMKTRPWRKSYITLCWICGAKKNG